MLKYSLKMIFSVGLIVVLSAYFIKFNDEVPVNNEKLSVESIGFIEVIGDHLEFSTNETETFIIDLNSTEANFGVVKFSILPAFLIPSQFSKLQKLVSYFLMAFVSLSIATQFRVESEKYELFNRNEDGSLFFENKTNEITHYLVTYAGMIFKALGVSCIFLAIIALVF